MWRRVLRWLGSLLVVGALALPAPAQELPGQEKKEERRPPAFEHALSIVGIMIVLLIICMPTRKR